MIVEPLSDDRSALKGQLSLHGKAGSSPIPFRGGGFYPVQFLAIGHVKLHRPDSTEQQAWAG